MTLLLGGLYAYSVYSFNRSLQAYIDAAEGHDRATRTPGAPDNTTRLVLNRILSEVLTGSHSDAERLDLAKEGLSALEVSDVEIDAIGDLGENVTNAINKLESRFTLLHRAQKKELVELARHHFEMAGDIRGLSYLANHHIAAIFNRIIDDNGALTAAHTADLNRNLPEVESDFDRRSNLYTDLETTGNAVKNLARTLARPW